MVGGGRQHFIVGAPGQGCCLAIGLSNAHSNKVGVQKVSADCASGAAWRTHARYLLLDVVGMTDSTSSTSYGAGMSRDWRDLQH